MVAAVDGELSSRVRICSRLDVLDMGSVDSDGNIVLRLASDCAGVATDAGSVVNHESVVSQTRPPSRPMTINLMMVEE